MKNKIFLSVAVFLVAGLILGNLNKGEMFTVYKSMNCGCCTGYIAELEKYGYDVNVVVLSDNDLSKLKDNLNVDYNMRSCHTTIVGDYFIEGHVPIESVKKLLSENPDIDGITLPGMPEGSPGMGGVKSEQFTVYSVKDGNIDIFSVI